MGNTVTWCGSQPDKVRQKGCTDFLRALAECLWWDYELFDGSLEGPHVNPELGRPEGWRRHWPVSQWHSFRFKYRKRLPLFGVTIYPWGKEGIRETYELWGQASFVFDNGLRRSGTGNNQPQSIESPPLPPPFGAPRAPERGEITTFERWTGRSEHGWKARPDVPGLYGYESQFRMGGDAEYLAWLLLYLRERFISNLRVDDDYGAFRAAEVEAGAIDWVNEVRQGDPQGKLERELIDKYLRKLSWSRLVGERIDLTRAWKHHTARLEVEGPVLPSLAEIAAEFSAPAVPLEEISIDLLQLDHSEQVPLAVRGVSSIADLMRYTDAELLVTFQGARQPQRYVETVKRSLHFALSEFPTLAPYFLVQYHLPSMREGQADGTPRPSQVRRSDVAIAIEGLLRQWVGKLRREDWKAAYRLCIWESEPAESFAGFRERLQDQGTLLGIIDSIELLRSPLVVGERAVARARVTYRNEGSTLVSFRDYPMLREGSAWKLHRIAISR